MALFGKNGGLRSATNLKWYFIFKYAAMGNMANILAIILFITLSGCGSLVKSPQLDKLNKSDGTLYLKYTYGAVRNENYKPDVNWHEGYKAAANKCREWGLKEGGPASPFPEHVCSNQPWNMQCIENTLYIQYNCGLSDQQYKESLNLKYQNAMQEKLAIDNIFNNAEQKVWVSCWEGSGNFAEDLMKSIASDGNYYIQMIGSEAFQAYCKNEPSFVIKKDSVNSNNIKLITRKGNVDYYVIYGKERTYGVSLTKN